MRYVVVCTKTCSDQYSLLKEVANAVIGVFKNNPDMSVESPCQVRACSKGVPPL